MEGVQQDLNRHILAQRKNQDGAITMAEGICKLNAACLNPIDGNVQERDYKRQIRQISVS